jgi:hypothetical protein
MLAYVEQLREISNDFIFSTELSVDLLEDSPEKQINKTFNYSNLEKASLMLETLIKRNARDRLQYHKVSLDFLYAGLAEYPVCAVEELNYLSEKDSKVLIPYTKIANLDFQLLCHKFQPGVWLTSKVKVNSVLRMFSY